MCVQNALNGEFQEVTTTCIGKTVKRVYQLSAETCSVLADTKVIEEASLRSGIQQGLLNSTRKIIFTPSTDLQGRRLTTVPQKGVYIMNNKKVVK